MENESAGSRARACLLPLGDTAWTVEFGDVIDPAVHARVLGLAGALAQARGAGRSDVRDAHEAYDAHGREFAAIVDVVPTFRSLTVHYDPLRCDGERLGESLLQLAATAGDAGAQGRQWQIPVCFAEEFAPDLNELAQHAGLEPQAAISLMTCTEFRVYLIGFMPGFPYMGGLPAALQMPRLSSPRKAVPERSLAVAGAMCAVYPWESPGGWRLIGRTPVPMFAAADADPALLASGDRVRWQAIDRATYLEMEIAFRNGSLDRRSLLVTAAVEGP